MNWQNRNVLITGAGGFIGSHLMERLIDLDANIRAFVRYNSRNDWGLIEQIPEEKRNNIEVVAGDLRDSDAIRQVTNGIDIIFHLGALIAIPYSYLHPRETIETNIIGTLNILTAVKENPSIKKIIHTSTSEVYGTAQYVPINENHPLSGQSPYSASKIGADKIAESFYKSFDIPVSIVRPFNTYGPRQSARAIIPTIITQTLSGDTIHLGALEPTRDYTFVKDTIEGFIKVAESPQSIGEVINIGSNFEISIRDLAEEIISIIGHDVKIVQDKSRLRPSKSEVERLWCNAEKAKELLNWEPTTSLQEGLKRTIDWISSNMNLYKLEIYNR